MVEKATNKPLHETQPHSVTIEADKPINEYLLPLQQIEGGGPIKKVILNTLPKPLRVFSYFLFSVMLVMLIMVCVVSLFR